MSSNYIIKVMSSYCDTIAIGDTLYRYQLIGSQLSTNRFVSPGASESALLYTHQVRNRLMIATNNRTLNFYYALLEPNIQYSVTKLFCHISHGEYPVPLRTDKLYVPFARDQKGVVEIRADSYKSTLLKGLRYINHWLVTYLIYDSAYLKMW
jgi:hypothetical protein